MSCGEPHQPSVDQLHTYPIRSTSFGVGIAAVGGQLLPTLTCAHGTQAIAAATAREVAHALLQAAGVVEGHRHG